MKFHDDDLEYIKSAKTKIQARLKEFAFYLNYANGLSGSFDVNSGLILNSMYLAGGVWASILLDTEIKDYDFFTTKAIFDPFHKTFIGRPGINFIKKAQGSDPNYLNFEVYDLVLEAEIYNSAIAKVRNGGFLEPWTENKKLQFIITDAGKFNKTPLEFIDDTFPFIHTRIYMQNNTLSISPDQYFCCLNKLLVPSPKTKHFPTDEQMVKYLTRGYKFTETKELYKKMDSMDTKKSILENTLNFSDEVILDELYKDLVSI